MTDTLKPCPIDEWHSLVKCFNFDILSSVECRKCGISVPFDVWQSLPRNEKPKPRPRTKEELIDSFWRIPGGSVEAVVTAAREDIAAMLREKIDRSGRTARDNGLLSQLADEIERMP